MNDAVLILFVEDECLILTPAQEALEEDGFDVIAAIDGAQAMRILRERTSQLKGLITDVRLGSGPDGWEIAREARRLRPDIPVVYTTGGSAGLWPAEGVPNSIIIQKPYAETQVVRALASLLSKAGVGRIPARVDEAH